MVMVDGAGPPLFQQAVKNVLWRTLSLGMQHSILQLCEAVKSDRVPETFLAEYLELKSEATEDSPRAPHIDRLGFGALAVICDKLKVPVPTGFSKAEMDKARARLQGLPGQGAFDVWQQVCGVARDDISWLKTQDVLGAGSVVMYGKMCQAAKVVLRPEVNVKVDRCTNICTRELTYFTADGKYLKPEAIGDTLVRTDWPLCRVPVEFAWEGPPAPYYLTTPEMRQQAAEWGIVVAATDSREKVRGLVMARAIAEYEKQHLAAVDAAWQAACAAAKPAEGQEEAAAKPLAPVDSQSTTTGSASSADRPNNAPARSSASSLWDMSTPLRGRSQWTTHSLQACQGSLVALSAPCCWTKGCA